MLARSFRRASEAVPGSRVPSMRPALFSLKSVSNWSLGEVILSCLLLRTAVRSGRLGGVGSATLYLVCGLPGAGKTTRSQLIVGSVPRAVHLCADDWVQGLGISLVDFEFRVKLQHCLLDHAGTLLRQQLHVVVEFGSWSSEERESIRRVAVREQATAELHFLKAPLDELVRRVRARGGAHAEALATDVLLRDSGKFEEPSAREIASFDRYFGPNDAWKPDA